MADIFWNITTGTLSADSLTADTTLDSAAFANLPVVTAPDTLRITLDADGSAGQPEIAIITAHSSGATTVTVTRGAESSGGGSTARDHLTGTDWTVAWTKAHADQLPFRLVSAKGDIIAATGDKAVTRVAVGTNDYPLVADSAASGGVSYKQLPTAGIADLAVTNGKVADGTLTTAKMNSSVAGNALAYSTSKLDVVPDGVTLAVHASDYIYVANAGIDTLQLKDGAVTSAKIATNTIIGDDIATNTITRALINAEAATTYTPQLDQGASTNIAKTVTYAFGTKVGRVCSLWWSVAPTGSGTAGSAVTITVPSGWDAASNVIAGSGTYTDTGVATYPGIAFFTSSTTIGLYRADTTITNVLGADPNFAVTNTDVFQGFATWISAS